MEQQAQQKAAKPKLPKHRSPNYPLIGLEKALERARTIQDQARNHFAPINVVYQLWKYKTGLGDQTLAALKAFGLAEIKGEKGARQVRLTEAAQRILGNALNRDELLKNSALRPELHRELWQKYNGDLPADSIIRNYLVFERLDRKFNKETVDGFIAQFRATIAFAKITLSDKVDNGEKSIEEEESPNQQTIMNPPQLQTLQKQENPLPKPATWYESFPLVLSRNSKGTLNVPSTISKKEFVLLKTQIENTLRIIEAAYLSDESDPE
jgi:hypothetical protein